MSQVESREVKPAAAVRGRLQIPGDKSVSHRVAMLCALANGESTVENFLASEDCLNTLGAVAALGAGVRREGTTVRIRGVNGRFTAPDAPLDLGNSGTGMRLLAGLLAGQPLTAELTGDDSLRSRPMRRITAPLEQMGIRVETLGPDGRAPLRIHGGTPRGIDYPLPVASAQVKSCVLLAGLGAEGRTTVTEPKPTRDHTERLLGAMGAPIRVDGLQIAIEGRAGAGPGLAAGTWRVPGDFSSAAFWFVAAAGREGGAVTVTNVGLNPRRTAFLDVLRRMGADVRVAPDAASARTQCAWEPVGCVTVCGRPLHGTTVGGDEIPNLIDELPLVAALGALAAGETVIRDAAELRVKESDRIASTVGLLHELGAAVRATEDGMVIRGGTTLQGAVVPSAGDHRIAMAAAVLGLFAAGPLRIEDTACVATSYPGFWDDRARLAGAAPAQSGEEG